MHTARSARPAAALAIIVLASLAARSAADSVLQQPRVLLSNHLHLSAREIALIDNGIPVAKTLPASEKREFVVVGAIRIKGSRQLFLDQYQDVVRFRKSQMVPQVGRFGTPPAPEDVAPLTLPAEDLEDLQACESGACKVQLPAGFIHRFRREVPWGTPGAAARANEIMRELLLDRARTYLAEGGKALGVYNHRETPLGVADEIAALLRQSEPVLRHAPELKLHLANFPNVSSSNTRDILYWAEERFGVKPVISVTHLAMHTPPGGDATVIAAKQIYASHYFDGSLTLTLVMNEPAAQVDSFYVAYITRTRVTRLGGMFGGVLRSRIQKRAQEGMGKALLVMKQRVENRSR